MTADGDIVCPFHHSVFSLETGAEGLGALATGGRQAARGRQTGKPTSYLPTKVEDGGIWIGVGIDDAV